MQKLLLSIPEPCHENWQQMTATDQGRFCNACAKEVVDFSKMTDMQVLNYFSTGTHKKVCGRALPDQLNRTISRPTDPKKRLFWYWNYIVMFFMFFGKGNAAKAQGGIKQVTECSPVKGNEINKRFFGKVGEVKIESRVVSGKITDKAGTPVPFASIKIKDANSGVAADANGTYSIKANPDAVLVISATGYKTIEVTFVNQTELNVIMESGNHVLQGDLVIVGSVTNSGIINSKNQIAILKIKDLETTKAINNATVIIAKNENNKADTNFVDKKGNYKIKGINVDDTYHVKIHAEGFEDNEFSIKGNDFNDRKKVWEVLLRRQQVEAKVPILITNKVSQINEVNKGINVNGMDNSNNPKRMGYEIKTANIVSANPVKVVNIANGLTAQMGGLNITTVNSSARKSDSRVSKINCISSNNQPMLVVDDLPVSLSNISSVKPSEVESIKVLKGTIAFALYGPDASDGAIVITTKKKAQGKMQMAKDTIAKKIINKVSDKISLAINKNTVKIYPNPVQKGNTFFISFKQQKINDFNICITDIQGRVMIQKQVNASTKEHFEKILTDASWSSGVYYISIIDNKSQLINKTSFILQ